MLPLHRDRFHDWSRVSLGARLMEGHVPSSVAKVRDEAEGALVVEQKGKWWVVGMSKEVPDAGER